MLQVTEDTPPDMLAGAMDLTVHLPTGKSVKMAVNRSTPMMDLLVQVTTAHRLQPSGHLIQALSCSPTSSHLEVILPYKPNTPIGALDTQHIRIIPKSPGKSGRSGTLPSGAQPFESTFRLQVHLPRNQLYVIRVSQYVMLQDIMKKVCNEKNLDPKKYEFRHPANLQEVLDPKLSLSDYQLTEVSVVQKGHTISLNDMAALQREEERRRQQSRNGGGVFNLIFKRGKTGVSSGSVSSDTRSISPSRSDDSQSRSISPPVLQTTKILQTIQQETTQAMPLPQEKPKPPQRKRRPAPKPPTANNTVVSNDHNLINSTSNENNQKNTANQNHNPEKKEIIETSLTISHSRNSSDSSGYHEASILSDTVNLQTLPRKNKHNTGSMSNISQKSGTQIVEDKSMTNLTRMEIQSKSTSNLVTTGRKKKPPPPPPVVESSVSTTIINKPTIVDARVESPLEAHPIPIPRNAVAVKNVEEIIRPVPKPRLQVPRNINQEQNNSFNSSENLMVCSSITNNDTKDENISNESDLIVSSKNESKESGFISDSDDVPVRDYKHDIKETEKISKNLHVREENKKNTHLNENVDTIPSDEILLVDKLFSLYSNDKKSYEDNSKTTTKLEEKSTEIKLNKEIPKEETMLVDDKINNIKDKKKPPLQRIQNIDNDYNIELEHNDMDMFERTSSSGNKKSSKKNTGIAASEIFDLKDTAVKPELKRDISSASLSSSGTIPEFMNSSNMKKWNNLEQLDGVSLLSENSMNAWVMGTEYSDTDSATNTSSWSKTSTRVSDISLQPPSNPPSSPPKLSISSETSIKLSEAPVKSSEKLNISTVDFSKNESSVKKTNSVTVDKKKEDIILLNSENNYQDLIETDWQYQLPPPPSEFRDSSPTNMTELTNYETVTLNGLPQSECTIVDTPQLLKSIEDFSDTISSRQSEVGSQISEDFGNKKSTEKILTSGYLSLDDLEKRKSMFLEKELASLSCDVQHEIASKKLINELEGVINGTTTLQRTRKKSVSTETDFSTLPNFQITTYNNQPKMKINIFEDDSIRSNNDNKRSNVEQISVRKTSGITERDLNIINNTITHDSQKPALKSKPILDEHIFKKPNLINLKNSPFSKSMNSLNASVENNNVKVNKTVQRSDSLYDKEVKELKLNPVKRSKSHISLDKYKNGTNGTNISNNWNVSDLQSLQVMRTILPKISNSQPSSPSENIQNHMEVKNTTEFKNNSEQIQTSTKTDKTESINEVRRYRYSPPSVNLGTWSERPKVTVNIKSDQDYKFGNSNDVSKKYVTSNIKNHSDDIVDSGKVSIKINDHSQQEVQKNSEKVIIKIAATETNKNFIVSPPKTVPVEPKPISQEQKALTMRIINHTTATGFKRPETKLPRPHSIAFDSSLTDISRIPIVRAVELKKTYQDNQNNDNTSITQINSDNLPTNVSGNEDHGVKTETTQNGNSSFNSVTRNGSFNISNGTVNGFHNSTYTLPHKNNFKNNPNYEGNVESKPYNFSTLLNRYSSSENINKPLKTNNHLLKTAPVVKGFRTVTPMETEKPKPSWKTNSLTKSLDSEKMLNKSYSANSSVPFSQSTLKYTNSITKRDLRNNDNNIANNTFTVNGITHYNNNNVPPPPPSMPKVKHFVKKPIVNNDPVDQRTQLLDAIKNFGGRESLKPIK